MLRAQPPDERRDPSGKPPLGRELFGRDFAFFSRADGVMVCLLECQRALVPGLCGPGRPGVVDVIGAAMLSERCPRSNKPRLPGTPGTGHRSVNR